MHCKVSVLSWFLEASSVCSCWFCVANVKVRATALKTAFGTRRCDCPQGICIASFDSRLFFEWNKTWTQSRSPKASKNKGQIHAQALPVPKNPDGFYVHKTEPKILKNPSQGLAWRVCFCKGFFLCDDIWVFPKIGIPQNGWFIMENPIKMIQMDDLGVPLFSETPIYVPVFVPFFHVVFFWCGAWEVLQDVFFCGEPESGRGRFWKVFFELVILKRHIVHKGEVLIECSWTRIPNSSKWNERYLCDANPLCEVGPP